MATRKKTTAPEQEVKEEVTAVQQPDAPSHAPARGEERAGEEKVCSGRYDPLHFSYGWRASLLGPSYWHFVPCLWIWR